MKNMYELRYLTDEFYRHYNKEEYPEIEAKMNRPYMVLLIKIDNNTFAIPFRTNIRHSFCYKFKKSNRSTSSVTGLDFTKAVVVNNASYIGARATIDNKEFVELNNKFYFIISKFRNYLSGYYKYVEGEASEYESKKYRYSTLRYFIKRRPNTSCDGHKRKIDKG